jgi:hypothetical protein
VTSIHQTTNLVFPNFFPKVLAVEKEKTFIGSKQVFSQCWTNESFFSFSTAQTEKKLGKTQLLVWWFDVMNKIYITFKFLTLQLVQNRSLLTFFQVEICTFLKIKRLKSNI